MNNMNSASNDTLNMHKKYDIEYHEQKSLLSGKDLIGQGQGVESIEVGDESL